MSDERDKAHRRERGRGDAARVRRGEILSTRGGPRDDTVHRARLKSMLEAAERRHRLGSAKRDARPSFVAGARVRLRRGADAGRLATVLDADYINARAEIAPDGGTPLWLPFADLAAVETP